MPDHCRRRMEKLLESDIRVQNAKVRLGEKSKNIRENMAEEKGDEDEKALKKRRLDDIEEAAMMEQDPEKLSNLFEEYRQEYMQEAKRHARLQVKAAHVLQNAPKTRNWNADAGDARD